MENTITKLICAYDLQMRQEFSFSGDLHQPMSSYNTFDSGNQALVAISAHYVSLAFSTIEELAILLSGVG